MRTIDLLRQLQTVDLALDQQREQLDDLKRRLADRAELEQALEQQQATEQRLRQLHSEQTDRELEVEQYRAKLKEIDDKLYGGRVRNPKELDGLAKEAEHYRQTIGRREDTLLELLEQVEQVQAEAGAARARHEQAEAAWQQSQATLSSEQGQVESEIERLESEQARLRGSLEAPTLRLYDGLRRTRGGVAVVEIRQRTCQGCRVSLPVSEEMRARAGQQLVTCQSCGRILFTIP